MVNYNNIFIIVKGLMSAGITFSFIYVHVNKPDNYIQSKLINPVVGN